MISQKSSQHQVGIFATPPPKKRLDGRSIMRKPCLVSFTKKKPTEISEIRSSDRIRFISPTRANLTIAQDFIDSQNSIELNYTHFPSNQQINYPFIRKCASPKNYGNGNLSRKSSLCQDNIKEDSVFLNTFLEPSIQDFSSCQFDTSPIKNKNQRLEEEISALKQANLELNELLEERNEQIERQKQEYDARLMELTNGLVEITKGIQTSESKMMETEQKMVLYQVRVKELQQKLLETNEKLDKAQKQVKMYKAKYRINFNNPKLTEDMKSKKYHQNCCKGHHNENHSKNHKNIQAQNQQKPNTLKESNKKSGCSEEQSLKKIKSETILPVCDPALLEPSPMASRLMKIHSNEEDFNEYISMKVHIENLSKEIRYKDIEILTLKKTKSQFEREKQNFEKVKNFNKKLLARVEFLTKQCDKTQRVENSQNRKRVSLPVSLTPKKKKFEVKFEEFDSESESDEGVKEIVDFELSPEKNYERTNFDTADAVFELKELK